LLQRQQVLQELEMTPGRNENIAQAGVGHQLRFGMLVADIFDGSHGVNAMPQHALRER